MQQIKWNKFAPRRFEQLCCELLKATGFRNIQWLGSGGSDKGRDITCTKAESPLPGSLKNKKWLVQCKRYIANQPTKSEVLNWLASCEEHNADNVLLVVTKMLSANFKDWLQSIQHKYSFDIHLWEEDDIRTQIFKHRAKLKAFFPELVKTGNKVSFYPMNEIFTHLSCNEMEEVFIAVMNADTHKEAREKAAEFVEFIKANNVVFRVTE